MMANLSHRFLVSVEGKLCGLTISVMDQLQTLEQVKLLSDRLFRLQVFGKQVQAGERIAVWAEKDFLKFKAFYVKHSHRI